MSAQSQWPESAPEESGDLRGAQRAGSGGEQGTVPLRFGDTVRDTENNRVGRVMGFEGPYVQLRPIGGGREWEARPEWLWPVTLAEALSVGVAAVNARSREGLL